MKKMIKVGLVSVIGFACVGWLYWGNESIQTTVYGVGSQEALSGFTIVQVSDLHNKLFGEDQIKLMIKIKKERPNIIVVTGDVIDSRTSDVQVAMAFFEEAVKIAPVYYVPGNHEARTDTYPVLKGMMRETGVHLIDSKQVDLNYNGEKLTIAGILDPTFDEAVLYKSEREIAKNMLANLQLDEEHFTILLSHRPELVDLYAESGADLVFSGHAHGGQIRLPFIGGVIAPNQGLFPTYTAGVFTVNRMNMVVSRGLGNSVIPLRVNNRPELVVVRLQAE